MASKFTSIKEYINQLPEDRQAVVEKMRQVFLKHLPEGFKETINYNMIGYVVSHELYPNGYHCDPKLPLPFINIASQKNFVALYHMGIYANKKIHDWFIQEYPKHCKYKLDMGKSCIRFKKMEDIPFDLLKELAQKMTPQDWIQLYESNLKTSKK
ncbi:MAG: DUF1801 domain-containing protein [Putridiphycobacter sp.]